MRVGDYMKIAICDDDRVFVREVEINIKCLLQDKRISADFDLFYKSDIIYDCNNFYDIAFLDIEMQPYTGIEIAEKLKSINPYIIIFIITSYDKYLDEAMDLNVFRYIKKPLDTRRLKNGLYKALESIDTNTISFFLKQGSTSKSIHSNDIQYIETIGRHTKVVTVKGEFISENKMDFWKEKLVPSFFYQVHKSFIINMKHITDYKRDLVILSDKYNIPISYRKRSEFKSYFLSYFGGR